MRKTSLVHKHRATSQVKILKYYPGAEITGVVKLDDDSMNMDGVRLLFERDAFSDEDGNEDNDTYHSNRCQ